MPLFRAFQQAAWVLSSAVLLAGCTHPATPPTRQVVDGMVVTLTASPPLHVGDNVFAVTLLNAATQAPIGNANITATPLMLAPRGLGADSSGRAQGNGLYSIPVRLAIATKYAIDLKIERPSKQTVEVSFPVEAVQ